MQRTYPHVEYIAVDAIIVVMYSTNRTNISEGNKMISKYKEQLEAIMLKRELSRAKRWASMKQRLHVDMEGFKTSYEDMAL